MSESSIYQEIRSHLAYLRLGAVKSQRVVYEVVKSNVPRINLFSDR